MNAAEQRWPQFSRVLVCGSRHLRGGVVLATVRDLLTRFGAKHVINGGQRSVDEKTGESYGVDHFATLAAGELRLSLSIHPARWRELGLAAGPIRNSEMLAEESPDLVLAVHDDWRLGKGTRDMVSKALAAAVPVFFQYLRRGWAPEPGRFIEDLPR